MLETGCQGMRKTRESQTGRTGERKRRGEEGSSRNWTGHVGQERASDNGEPSERAARQKWCGVSPYLEVLRKCDLPWRANLPMSVFRGLQLAGWARERSGDPWLPMTQPERRALSIVC